MIRLLSIGLAALACTGCGSSTVGQEKDPPKKIVLDLGGGVKMEFVRIKAGKFMMGDDDNAPAHEVTLTRDFWMQTTETTQTQWEAVMRKNPSHFEGADLPVERVSWEDCREFLKKLNEKVKDPLKGRTAGLPTEAEWEYACRAGSTTKWSFGDDGEKLGEYAWYDRNSESKTHAVGTKKANAWGLYDVHGNVWEWCEDWYGEYASGAATDPKGPSSSIVRCLRGGCFGSDGDITRSANRDGRDPANRNGKRGLRVALR
ncbi:MAG: formylglycine-generating enzyme family protein [Planctomycetes bacterium]|nr:formylglycine-generating enzyme family protein [Planctomycetota bacterium]